MRFLFFFSFLLFSITLGYGQATANQPDDLAICQSPNTGFAIFDLTQQDAEILGSQSPLDYAVLYFLTQVDANNNFNPIANAMMYNNISNPQQIYARVENLNNSDFDTTSFAIQVLSEPMANTPTPLEICDDDNDGFAAFDLTIKDAEIAGGDPSVFVLYFETTADANAGVNALASPYQNIVPFTQTVYARAEHVITGCFVIVELALVVYEMPEPSQPTNIFINDGNGDGTAVFDLTVNDEILAAGIANAEVAYYEALEDAQMLTNPILTPTMFVNTTNPQTIYATVQNGDTFCYAVTSFLIAADQTGLADNDSDLVPDVIEDINANGDLTDDDTDNDTIPNFQDDDDDGDGTPTADEDYNDNGSPTDDDTNNNRVPDYLDDTVTLSISEVTLDTLRLFPNPGERRVVVDFGSVQNTIAVSVYTVQGVSVLEREHKSVKSVQLDISSYASGVYFVRIVTQDGAATIRFIKK